MAPQLNFPPDLFTLREGDLHFRPVRLRYEAATKTQILPLAATVIVGVDDIPSRWLVQEAMPQLLIVGATTHWGAMASFHCKGLGCTRCLHDRDAMAEPIIATTACVSFWAGLLTAAYLVRLASGERIPSLPQQTFMMPYRPENTFPSGVMVRSDCPICNPVGRPPPSYVVYAPSQTSP